MVLVRSSGELTAVRRAAQVLEQSCGEMLKTVEPGATELDVYAAIQSILSRSGFTLLNSFSGQGR